MLRSKTYLKPIIAICRLIDNTSMKISKTEMFEIILMEKGCKMLASGILNFHSVALTKCAFPMWAKLLRSTLYFARPGLWQLILLKLLVHMSQNAFSVGSLEVEFEKVDRV